MERRLTIEKHRLQPQASELEELLFQYLLEGTLVQFLTMAMLVVGALIMKGNLEMEPPQIETRRFKPQVSELEEPL
jgi:hypothetical protein